MYKIELVGGLVLKSTAFTENILWINILFFIGNCEKECKTPVEKNLF